MKNTYTFILLVCLTLYSFGNNHITLDITSVNSNDTNFYATDKKQPIIKKTVVDNRLKIRLEIHTSANFNREILLTIDARSTDDVDKGFDAYLFDEHPNDMYWMLGEDKLIIQAFNELPIDRVVPIGITSMGDCSLQIKVTSIENPYEGMEVYLRDNETLETYDIKNEIFEVTLEEGQFNDKYAVVFKPKVEIEFENEEVVDNVHVFADEHNNMIRIRKPEEVILGDIALYNMLGQRIKVWNTNLNENEFNLPVNVNMGVHVVLMNTSKGRLTKKLIIK